MTDPDIRAIDEDGNELDDVRVRVDGKVPGEGGDGLWTTDADGNLVPVDGRPLHAEELGITEDGIATGMTVLDHLGQIPNLNADGKPITNVDNIDPNSIGEFAVYAGNFDTVQDAVDYAHSEHIPRVIVGGRNHTLETDRLEIPEGLHLEGGNRNAGGRGTRLASPEGANEPYFISLDVASKLSNLRIDATGGQGEGEYDDGIVINGSFATIRDCMLNTLGVPIRVHDDNAVFVGNYGADVIFEDGTSGGEEAANPSSDFTDNGTNL